jgi:two-component system sensor histidine kinase DegS
VPHLEDVAVLRDTASHAARGPCPWRGGVWRSEGEINVWMDRRQWEKGRTSGPQFSERDLVVMREERHRLVRELQDGPLQRLTGLGLRLDLCEELMETNEAAAVADELAQLKLDLHQIVAGIRALMVELRAPRLEDVTLAGLIDSYVRDCRQRMGTGVTMDLAGLSGESLDLEQKLAAFRIVQEALRNASQHSGASRVEIRGTIRGSLVELTVEDDGRGFNLLGVSSSYPRRGLGLAGMQQRAKAVGGRVEIDSKADHGTCITLTIPVDGRHT